MTEKMVKNKLIKGGVPAFILHIFCYFCRKNKRNVDFDQRTACGAPVCWSKFTTQMCAPRTMIIP